MKGVSVFVKGSEKSEIDLECGHRIERGRMMIIYLLLELNEAIDVVSHLR